MLNQETDRLIMKALGIDDLPFMLKLTSNQDVIRYIPSMITNADIMEAWLCSLKPEDHEYQIILRETGIAIGECSLTINPDGHTADVGYMLLPEYWNHGQGTEAVTWLIGLAKNLGIEKVAATTHDENVASKHLLEKLGFRKESVGWLLHEKEDEFTDICVETYACMISKD